MKVRYIAGIMMLTIGLLGCTGEPASEPPEQVPQATQGEEDRYELRGVIVDRDPMANTVKVDHEAIGDWMGAMTMTFPVRGTDVTALPEKGQPITATVHVAGTEFWISDIQTAEETPAD